MTKEILLIRHTTPEVEPGICYGQLNVDVTDSFGIESDEIKNAINAYTPEIIYSSPLKRCSKLATYLFTDYSLETDDRLMEINFGDWEGNPWDNVERAIMDRWAKDFIELRPPNGESFRELIERTESFIEDVIKAEHNKIAIVTHSGIIRSLLIKYLNIPPRNIFNLHLNYGCIVKLKIKNNLYQQIEFIKG